MAMGVGDGSKGEGRSLVPRLCCFMSLPRSITVPGMTWVDRSIVSRMSETSMNGGRG